MLPLKARSELMNVRLPGLVVSNSAGFGVNETSFMPLAAVAASSFPGLSPSRGSLPVGYVCACSAGAAASANATTIAATRVILIRRCSVCWLLRVGEHLMHERDF